MHVNTSSKTFSSRLPVYNCLVATPDGAGTQTKKQPAGNMMPWLSRRSTASHCSCVCLEASWVRSWTEKGIFSQQSTQEALDCVAAWGMFLASSEPSTKQQKGKTLLARKASCSEGESCPEVGILLLVIKLLHLELDSMFPQGTV